MPAAVEVREPLFPLHTRNSKDLGHQSSALGRLSHRRKEICNSASLGTSRTLSSARVELIDENFACRGAPEPIAEDSMPVTEMKNRSTEEQGESGSKSLSRSNDREEKIATGAGDEQESESLVQLKMEAMTWAAMAKDYTISSLERRLRQALEIAKSEQDRIEELGRLLRESKQREAAAALELQGAMVQIGQLIEAEERLCVQLGDLEVEAVEEDRRYRSQIATLMARIEAQDQFIAEALTPFKAGQSPSQQSDSLRYVQTGQYHSLAEKLEMAKTEFAALQADLMDATIELRVAEGLRKSQARRLKALEKERRNLMRKGAIRSIALAPRSHRKSGTGTAGTEGWKVFSILDFEA